MKALKTLLYMGVMHGFFTFYFPYQLASLESPLFDLGIFRYLALLLWIAGTLIIVQCSIDIIRLGRGTPAHLDPPKTLIINGLYRYVRNPIYLGALFVILGYILWFGSRLLVAYFLFAALAFHTLITLIEEPVLRSSFGAAYEAYRKRVPRWIPRF
jgi:protein-S-isoprenylcysteine O-methyltransferase Ste14